MAIFPSYVPRPGSLHPVRCPPDLAQATGRCGAEQLSIRIQALGWQTLAAVAEGLRFLFSRWLHYPYENTEETDASDSRRMRLILRLLRETIGFRDARQSSMWGLPDRVLSGRVGMEDPAWQGCARSAAGVRAGRPPSAGWVRVVRGPGALEARMLRERCARGPNHGLLRESWNKTATNASRRAWRFFQP